MNILHLFLLGASSFGHVVAALFFARFWRETKDRLFALFALAFGVMAVSRAVTGIQAETHEYVYVVRLVAFIVIALAIIDKNRR